MKVHAFREEAFAAALIDRALSVPDCVTSQRGSRPERRFAVYRNNVSSALNEAVAVRYPVVERLVGRDFFRAATREYVLDTPPRSPVLIDYGRDFPEFLATFPPAAGLPYLSDVATLERAYWEAYHAADAKPVDAAAFAAIEAERLPAIRFEFLPSVTVLASSFLIVSIWHTNTHDAEAKSVDLSKGEDAVVARPGFEVEIHRLPPGAASFLKSLMGGAALGEAAAGLHEGDSAFDLAFSLEHLIKTRIIVRIS